VLENYWNWASRRKFHSNEFFERANKIEAAQTHFRREQMNITRRIYTVSKHNYAPKVAWVIKTRGRAIESREKEGLGRTTVRYNYFLMHSLTGYRGGFWTILKKWGFAKQAWKSSEALLLHTRPRYWTFLTRSYFFSKSDHKEIMWIFNLRNTV
jgi:hypothetical protein